MTANAQTFTSEPGETLYISNVPIGSLTIHDIYQVNATDSNLTMAWERVFVDIPETWDYSFCDLGTCYPGIPDGATMVQENETGYSSFLGLNLIPDQAGEGMVQINVWDVDYPDYKVLSTFIFSTGIVGVGENSLANISFFPNPATDFLNVTNPSAENIQVEILDLRGSSVKSILLQPGTHPISINELAAGAYLLRVLQGENVVSKIFHVSK